MAGFPPPPDFNTQPVLNISANQFTYPWQKWLSRLASLGASSSSTIAAGKLGTQPTGLGVSDAGRTFFVTTSADGLTGYYHTVVWTGAAWDFNGDPSGRIIDESVDPGEGWQTADGTVTKRLTAGATLGEAAMTAANEGAGTYHKSGVYDGTVNAAAAPTFTGTPGTTSAASAPNGGTAGTDLDFVYVTHTHAFTPAGTVSATGEPANLKVQRYYRR